MADYRLKQEVIQAMQVNETDFEAIYGWALSHNKALDKTDTSFSLVHDNQTFRVRKNENNWIIKIDDSWLMVSDYRFNQLFKAA